MQKLVTDERVAFFSFIGSSAVGWKLRSFLAPGTRFALEHGGVAPIIVCPSAKKPIGPKLGKRSIYHSGHVFVSVQGVFYFSSSGKELADRKADQASKLVVGNAIEAETQCGPLIRNREVDRVESRVAEAVDAGLKLYVVVTSFPVPVMPPPFCLIPLKLARYRDKRSLVMLSPYMKKGI